MSYVMFPYVSSFMFLSCLSPTSSLLRLGIGGDVPKLAAVLLRSEAEGDAAEGPGGAAGHRRCASVPLPPPPSPVPPPPTTHTFQLLLHWLDSHYSFQYETHTIKQTKHYFFQILYSTFCSPTKISRCNFFFFIQEFSTYWVSQ